ncbi:pPIWI_RE module domain-containing protein [Streptomyces sioyaensis]|uniref:pPIWI_RE module domain-containing protein n=1 Tax=Streptomyces sioyaensis TaxID=67364 RepID=UPI003D73B500
MGFQYASIDRSAFRPVPDAEPLKVRYRAMERPEHWNDALLELTNHGLKPGATPWRTVPTWRLEGSLGTLCPELCLLPRPEKGEPTGLEGDFWFLTPYDIPDPLPPGALDGMLNLWAVTLPRNPAPQKVPETLERLRSDPPRWRDTEVDLLGCPTSGGETSLPWPFQYRLTTDWLARRIEELPPYDSGNGLLHFHAVPRGYFDKGAELMSQPLRHDAKGKVWWWSVVIHLALHSAPFDPLPRIHLSLGVRRWATHPSRSSGRLYLPPGQRTSVYLRCPVPWLPGAPLSGRYTIARLQWSRKDRAHVWHENDAAGLLRPLALNQRHPLPDPEELLSEPEARIGDGPGMRAAVVHSAAMGTHEVERGMMPHQRSQLFEWARQAFPAQLRPLPTLHRNPIGDHQPRNPRPKPSKPHAKTAEAVRAAEERRLGLASAMRFLAEEGYGSDAEGEMLPPVFESRLLWTTHRMRQEVIDGLVHVLGLKGEGGAPESQSDAEMAYDASQPGAPVVLEWQTPELIVRLRCLPLGALGDDLAIDTGRRSRKEAFVDGVIDRRRATSQWLSSDGVLPNRPTLAIVEIDQDVFTPSHADPKYALRLGCADAGVVSQFVRVPRKGKGYNTEKDADHRARMGWLDGFRQLGVRVLPEHSLGGRLPEGLRYAAVWSVKRRSDGPTRTALAHPLPVALLMTPDGDGSGRARVHGWDRDEADWVPYPAMLVRLTRNTGLDSVRELASDVPGLKDEVPLPGQRQAEQATQEPHGTTGSGVVRATGEVPAAEVTDSRRKAGLRDEQRRAMERFLQHVIPTLQGEPTVLFAHAQNLRATWPWLQDGQVRRDLLKAGHVPASGLDPDLRLVRIRDGGGNSRETPQWWGIGNPNGINGLGAGLWGPDGAAGPGDTDDRRVFYSTTEKASQFTGSAVQADKLAPRLISQGPRKGETTLDTGIPAWNPHLCEITVLGCHREDGDLPAAYALVAHQLRQAADYKDALAKPLPLHLAEKAEEYVLPLPAGTDADSSDEGEKILTIS